MPHGIWQWAKATEAAPAMTVRAASVVRVLRRIVFSPSIVGQIERRNFQEKAIHIQHVVVWPLNGGPTTGRMGADVSTPDRRPDTVEASLGTRVAAGKSGARRPGIACHGARRDRRHAAARVSSMTTSRRRRNPPRHHDLLPSRRSTFPGRSPRRPSGACRGGNGASATSGRAGQLPPTRVCAGPLREGGRQISRTIVTRRWAFNSSTYGARSTQGDSTPSWYTPEAAT